MGVLCVGVLFHIICLETGRTAADVAAEHRRRWRFWRRASDERLGVTAATPSSMSLRISCRPFIVTSTIGCLPSMSLDGLEEDDPSGRLLPAGPPRRRLGLLAYGSQPQAPATLLSTFSYTTPRDSSGR